jgi:hypothetical protein
MSARGLNRYFLEMPFSTGLIVDAIAGVHFSAPSQTAAASSAYRTPTRAIFRF